MWPSQHSEHRSAPPSTNTYGSDQYRGYQDDSYQQALRTYGAPLPSQPNYGYQSAQQQYLPVDSANYHSSANYRSDQPSYMTHGQTQYQQDASYSSYPPHSYTSSHPHQSPPEYSSSTSHLSSAQPGNYRSNYSDRQTYSSTDTTRRADPVLDSRKSDSRVAGGDRGHDSRSSASYQRTGDRSSSGTRFDRTQYPSSAASSSSLPNADSSGYNRYSTPTLTGTRHDQDRDRRNYNANFSGASTSSRSYDRLPDRYPPSSTTSSTDYRASTQGSSRDGVYTPDRDSSAPHTSSRYPSSSSAAPTTSSSQQYLAPPNSSATSYSNSGNRGRQQIGASSSTSSVSRDSNRDKTDRRKDPLPYTVHLRRYVLTRPYLTPLDLKQQHPDLHVSMDLSGVRANWTSTVPWKELNDTPPIPLNQHIPCSVDNTSVPSTPSGAFVPPTLADNGSGNPLTRTQVRVMLLKGSPIDTSAIQGPFVHINSSISFLILERRSQDKDIAPGLYALGGLYNPELDGVDTPSPAISKNPSETADSSAASPTPPAATTPTPTTKGRGAKKSASKAKAEKEAAAVAAAAAKLAAEEQEIAAAAAATAAASAEAAGKANQTTDSHSSGWTSPSDAVLIRTAIRTVKEQVGLDLSACSTWHRFMEIEWSRDSSTVNDRTVYFIPSVWELIPSPEEFEQKWTEWKKDEIRMALGRDIDRLTKQLSQITDVQSAVYLDVSSRLQQKEVAQKNVELGPNDVVPARPHLLMRTNSAATNESKAFFYSLYQLLAYQAVSSQDRFDETNDLAIFSELFNDYLQYYFGRGIFASIAPMRSKLLAGAKPILVEGVSYDRPNKKRPRPEHFQNGDNASSSSLTELQNRGSHVKSDADGDQNKRPKLAENSTPSSSTTSMSVASSAKSNTLQVPSNTTDSSSPVRVKVELLEGANADVIDATYTKDDADDQPTDSEDEEPGYLDRSKEGDHDMVMSSAEIPMALYPSTEPVSAASSASGAKDFQHSSASSSSKTISTGSQTSISTSGTQNQQQQQSQQKQHQQVRNRGPPGWTDRSPPAHRDHHLMQACRFFDLNRAGVIKSEDLEDIILSCDLGFNRKVAAELVAASDLNLSHKPAILTGYDRTKNVRYKPICDWVFDEPIFSPVDRT